MVWIAYYKILTVGIDIFQFLISVISNLTPKEHC